MACYNPDTEEYQSVCRVMSGFSDSFYTEVNVDVEVHIVVKAPYVFEPQQRCDDWFNMRFETYFHFILKDAKLSRL